MSTSGSGSWNSTDEERSECTLSDSQVGVDVGCQSIERDGPQVSEGSIDHPDKCKPCAFYCYSLRGCNKGASCSFCHLEHIKRKKKSKGKDAKKAPNNVSAFSNRLDETNAFSPPMLASAHSGFRHRKTQDVPLNHTAMQRLPPGLAKEPVHWTYLDLETPVALPPVLGFEEEDTKAWDEARFRLFDLITQELTGTSNSYGTMVGDYY